MIKLAPAARALAVGLLATSLAAPAFAQSTTGAPAHTTAANPNNTSPAAAGPSTSTAPAAVATSNNPRTTAAPVPGANSYTEGQARARMQEKGFANVTDLKKDDKGVWRATAMKDGKSTTVALDYQGNVVSN